MYLWNISCHKTKTEEILALHILLLNFRDLFEMNQLQCHKETLNKIASETWNISNDKL